MTGVFILGIFSTRANGKAASWGARSAVFYYEFYTLYFFFMVASV